MKEKSLWRTMPRPTLVVFLSAVFFVFTSFGFASDIIDMGRQPPLRFAIGVVLSGLFAVFYAFTGISLRRKSWIVCPPVFVLQFVGMGMLAQWVPDVPQTIPMGADEIAHLHTRLVFDGVATMAVVLLGYACFSYASVSESKRHVRVRTEMAVLESEMAAAKQVQQVILPAPGESFPGYAVQSVYRPAQQVGGDFFQILPAGSGGLLIVFGDVAGKGLPAAMLVSLLVGSIRATAEDSYDPAVLLQRLHDRLVGRTSGGFCTAVAAYIAHDGQVSIANAGHLSPYVDGREIELAGALPLGIAGGGQYEIRKLELPAGGRLTLLSDGVVEAQNGSGELFGFDRAKAISTQAAVSIADAAVHFGQTDDITVVTIERLLTH